MVETDASPEHLYRYRSLAGQQKKWVKDSIVNSLHYFSSPNAFNDPFDCRPVFRLDGHKEEVIKYYEGVISRQAPHWSRQQRRKEARAHVNNPATDPRNPRNLRGMHHMYDEMVTSKIGVLCLSETCRDILMWSHYADAHKGICLKYYAIKNVFETAQVVHYEELRPVINARVQTPDEMLDRAIFTKSEHWAYEKEWRLIQYKTGAGIYRTPPEALVGIVFGAQIDAADRTEVLNWVATLSQPPTIYQATVSNTKFELVINELHNT